MLCNFGSTSSKERRFSGSLQRLGICFSSRVWLATAGVAALLLPATARAIPFVPDPEAVISYCSDTVGGVCADTVVLGFGTVIRDGGFLSGDVFDKEVAVRAGGTANTFKRMEAKLTYYFAAVGPPGDIVIPYHITYSVHTSAVAPINSFAAAQASLRLTSRPTAFVFRSLQSTSKDTVKRADFSGTEMFDMHLDSVGTVEMYAHGTTTFAGGAGRARVDPYIFIDPDFLRVNPGYSVIVSAGIDNALPVPEPTTWILFASGLLIVGRLAQRRAVR